MNTPLKNYIKKRNISLTSLAKMFGISRGHMTTVANGGAAGKGLALQIEQWSDGEVSRVDLLYPTEK